MQGGASSLRQLNQQLPSMSLILNMGSRCLSSEVKTEKRSGGWGKTPPVTMTSLVVALMAGAGILSGVNSFKENKLQQKSASSQEVAGKAAVGGPFVLTDMNGKPFSDQDLLGEFALLYFGFTFCPDICPDELEKVAQVVEMIEKQASQ
jgi:cytochrome oxidase Cu insertion factor (SCO1/SenC/PrrC family)